MNDVQNVIDRQLGNYCRRDYDNVLKRLMVMKEESFYGLQNSVVATAYDQDPPIFACRFAEAPGYEHILALANEDGKVAIQNTSSARTASLLEGFQCHNNAVFDLAWVPGNMNFVTVSGDHTACLWDISEDSPKRISVFSSHTRSVKTAVFRPNEPSVFATGARDGHILIWDVRSNNNLPCLVVKPDNSLMNCHSSFTPKTPCSSSKRPRIDTQRATSITGLVFQDDITLISCGECDGNIKVWDLRKNYNIYKREPLPKHSIPYCGSSTKNGYTNLIIDDARIRLYASCMDNVIYCFNISTYNTLPEQRYVGHENSTFYIKTSLSADGAYLVSGSSDKLAYVWNVRRAAPVVRLAGHWAEVTCAAWSRATAPLALVTCSDDARHKIWRVGSEHLNDADTADLKGRAEPVPHTERRARDTTPRADRQPAAGAVTAPRTRLKTKRCLAELLNCNRDDTQSVKRLKTNFPPIPEEEDRLLPAGIKRHLEPYPSEYERRCSAVASTSGSSYGWSYNHLDGDVTPTKNYEKRPCLKLSPKSPKINTCNRTPVKVSPTKVRIITFSTPTEDLPNFVMNGDAPHLKLMSPAKKKEKTNWLTVMRREHREKYSADAADKPITAALSPKETPARRSSTDKTPKSNKNRTLLKYFSITLKNNN